MAVKITKKVLLRRQNRPISRKPEVEIWRLPIRLLY